MRFNNWFKAWGRCHRRPRLSFLTLALWALVVLVLVLATILEKMYGTPWIHAFVYDSWCFVALWALAGLTALMYICRKALWRRPVVFMLHLSLGLILLGALITFCFGQKGSVHVRIEESVTVFYDEDMQARPLPMKLKLDAFEVICYPGTDSPADYQAYVSFWEEGSQKDKGLIAMNKIQTYRHYRFYQSGYDPDRQGCTFLVSRDPWGIAITYTAYALLFLTMILFLLMDKSYRQLLASLRSTSVSSAVEKSLKTIALLLMLSVSVNASASVSDYSKTKAPKVLPQQVAAEFGDLYVYYNGRICPLQTLAKDFTLKLYGKASYEGYSCEQVFTGWMFYYASWKEQPMIKTKTGRVRGLLNSDEKYVAFEDFRGPRNEYLLEDAMSLIRQAKADGETKSIVDANEKFNLVATFYSGKLMKIYPHADASGQLRWYTQGDNDLPSTLSDDEWFFIKKSWDYVHELVIKKDYRELSHVLQKIKLYQQQQAHEVLPSRFVFEAEKYYNIYFKLKWVAFPALFVGLFFLFYTTLRLARKKPLPRVLQIAVHVLTSLLLLMLTAVLVLRWIIGGHVPLSNGAETMQFMAWLSLIASLFASRKLPLMQPFGLLLCGLTCAVAMMSGSHSPISLLMPVLASPLMSIHVAVIMLAYVLMAFMMLNGWVALMLHFRPGDHSESIANLADISRVMLYPAVFLLTMGIFIGAVWANVSWGAYWSWDPKEVWALITMLIYASAMHRQSLPAMRRPMYFHVFCILAFLSVLVTYFGVNFILGGMHSYAG